MIFEGEDATFLQQSALYNYIQTLEGHCQTLNRNKPPPRSRKALLGVEWGVSKQRLEAIHPVDILEDEGVLISSSFASTYNIAR